MKSKGMSIILAAALLFSGAAFGEDARVDAVTRPSDDASLGFIRAGKIAQILVKEGDAVAADQVLIQLDDIAEAFQLKQLEAQANDVIRIKAAEAQLTQKKEEVEKLKQAEVKKWDISRAELDVIISDLSLQLSKFEKEQAMLKFEEAKAQLDRMKLRSPFAGQIEVIVKKTGESVDALQQIIRVVKVDPLIIYAPAPKDAALLVKKGDTASVYFPGVAEPVEGKIMHVGAVADPASNTLTVQIEVPNKLNRPAGERVKVKLSK